MSTVQGPGGVFLDCAGEGVGLEEDWTDPAGKLLFAQMVLVFITMGLSPSTENC